LRDVRRKRLLIKKSNGFGGSVLVIRIILESIRHKGKNKEQTKVEEVIYDC